MKKLTSTILAILAIIILIGAVPARADSYGLAVGAVPDSTIAPTKITWLYGHPMYAVRWVDTPADNGMGAGWIVGLGNGLPYDVKVNGDETDRQVSVKIMPSPKLAKGYKHFPLQYVHPDLDSWIASPSDGYVRCWLRFFLPDQPKYHDRKYQFSVEISVGSPAGPAQYVYGDTVYIVTDN